jgi:hypothetical protein
MIKTIPLSGNEVIEEIRDLFKPLTIKKVFDFNPGEQINLFDDDLYLHVLYNNGYNLVCVDNKKCYNKESQCAVFFTLPLSDRKKERLKKALDFLRTKEGERASATFEFKQYGFDEFGSHVRKEFYQNI